MATPSTWRADFFDNRDETTPVRTTYINAENEDDAAKKASTQMGNCLRVDLTRTVFHGSHRDQQTSQSN